jgi:hypothetical protein
MPIIVFDYEYIGDNDQFIRTIREHLNGYLLRFTMNDGSVIDGVVKGDVGTFFNELTVELWDKDDPNCGEAGYEPTYQTVDLDQVAEVFYY